MLQSHILIAIYFLLCTLSWAWLARLSLFGGVAGGNFACGYSCIGVNMDLSQEDAFLLRKAVRKPYVSFVTNFPVAAMRRHAWREVCVQVFKNFRKNGESLVKKCSLRVFKCQKSWALRKS